MATLLQKIGAEFRLWLDCYEAPESHTADFERDRMMFETPRRVMRSDNHSDAVRMIGQKPGESIAEMIRRVTSS